VAACNGGGAANGGLDLTGAEREIAEGRIEQGLGLYADAWRALGARDDWEAAAVRARILQGCLDAGAVEAVARGTPEFRLRMDPLAPVLRDRATLSTLTAASWIGVLNDTSSAPAQVEAARGLARVVRAKLERPELRRGRLEAVPSPLGDAQYARLLAETLAECERYVVGRTPAGESRDVRPLAGALRRWAATLEALAPAAQAAPPVAALWKGRAESLVREAAAITREPERVMAGPETRGFVEADAREQVGQADEWAMRASAEIARRAGPERVVEPIEAALRRYLFVLETVGPDHPSARPASEAIAYWYPRLAEWVRREP
jgi:hypothetical protein